MSRHPIDHQTPSDGGRTKEFARVERELGGEDNHPAVQALNRRPAGRAEKNTKAAEYARIGRGRRA